MSSVKKIVPYSIVFVFKTVLKPKEFKMKSSDKWSSSSDSCLRIILYV